MATRKKNENRSNHSKFMAALSIFGAPALKKWLTKIPNPVKGCIQCGRRHRHNNAFCDSDCCQEWRAENPHRGRLNHYHHPETGEVMVSVKLKSAVA